MADQRTVVYDSGRWPLWVRLPCLAFGLFLLTLAADLVAVLLLRDHFLPFLEYVPQSMGVTIAAVAFILVVGLAFTNAWVFRRRVVLVPDDSLRVELDWLGGTLGSTVPLSEIAAVELVAKRSLGTSRLRWLVHVRRSDAGVITLLETVRQEEAEALAERLSWMLGVSSEQV